MVGWQEEKSRKKKIIKELIFVFRSLHFSAATDEVENESKKSIFIFITSSKYAYCTASLFYHHQILHNVEGDEKREAD